MTITSSIKYIPLEGFFTNVYLTLSSECLIYFSYQYNPLEFKTYAIKLSQTTLQGQPCFSGGIRPIRKTCCLGAVMSVKVGVTVGTSFDCLDFNVSFSMEIVVVTKSCVQK